MSSAPLPCGKKPYRAAPWICLLLALSFIGIDSTIRHRLSHAAETIRTSSVRPGTVRISPGAIERMSFLPPASMDSRWWVIHAEKLIVNKKWRVRSTSLDNAPTGREVHWSSSLSWILTGAAYILGYFTHRTAFDCVAEAASLIGPFLLLTLALALCILVRKLTDWTVAGLFFLALCTSLPIYEFFRLGEADHHGLVVVLSMASVLCLLRGNSMIAPEKKRSDFPWFIASGLVGSIALWISAATFLPVLVGIGIGAILSAFLHPRAALTINPLRWTQWGLAGCAGGLFFYLVEYFPSHVSWRLEVNHPLYAMAWFAAGYLLTVFISIIRGRRLMAREVALAALALLTVALPIVLIFCLPGEVFWVSDPFLLALHTKCIGEFQPAVMFPTSGQAVFTIFNFFIWPIFVMAGLAFLCRSSLPKSEQALLVLATCPAVVLQILAINQIRWSGMAVGLWLISASLIAFFSLRRVRLPLLAFISLGAIAAFGVLLYPQLSIRTFFSREDWFARIPKEYATSILLRDVAHRLVQSSPEKLPIVLSGPTSSSDLTYFGALKTLGTLYWENLPGLRHAATIFSQTGEAATKDLMKKAGITHVVVTSWENFGSTYASLLATPSSAKENLYLDRVLLEQEFPDWLHPLYYPIPSVFGMDGAWIKVFRVDLLQSPSTSLTRWGVYFFEAGNFHQALKFFKTADQRSPGDPNIMDWVTKTETEIINQKKL